MPSIEEIRRKDRVDWHVFSGEKYRASVNRHYENLVHELAQDIEAKRLDDS